jgi:hypothetical protein
MIQVLKADLRKTSMMAILLGLNTRGQTDVTPLETDLRDQFPVFFSEYRRQTRSSRLQPGALWYFRESQPILIGAMLKDAPSSPARLRHLEQALVSFRQEYQREGITSLAIAPLGSELEWPALYALLEEYLRPLPIAIEIYEAYVLGQEPPTE